MFILYNLLLLLLYTHVQFSDDRWRHNSHHTIQPTTFYRRTNNRVWTLQLIILITGSPENTNVLILPFPEPVEPLLVLVSLYRDYCINNILKNNKTLKTLKYYKKHNFDINWTENNECANSSKFGAK